MICQQKLYEDLQLEDFNLLLYVVNLIALHLNCCIVSYYTHKNQITQWNCTNKTFTVPSEKSNSVSFASSRIN